MARARKLWWAYISELLLSSLIVWLALIYFGEDAVSVFARTIGMDAAALLGVALFSAAIGMIMLIHQRLDAPFYQWLLKKGALDAFIAAFKYVAMVCVLSVLFVVLSKNSSSQLLAILTLYLLVLLGLNAVTFLNNVTGLMRLEIAFRKKAGSLPRR